MALNRTFAVSKVHSCEKAIEEAKKLGLTGNNYYHKLMGYLYSGNDINNAICHYKRTLELAKSQTEQQSLKKEIKRLKNNDNG
ncbi:hypothetical protein [Olivibacter sp. XZL3]|uniref:hypothetical protein n=1 Tax=Olivibacter sp. XZL3 TaxID=1735116 RepID=UPI0010659C06|nr:hypothetical protein [Olivibacter sp. XZL3]